MDCGIHCHWRLLFSGKQEFVCLLAHNIFSQCFCFVPEDKKDISLWHISKPPDGSNQQGGGGQPLLPVNTDESVLEQTEPSDPAGMEIFHIVIYFLLFFFTSFHWIRLTVLFCYILCPLQFILKVPGQIYRAFFNGSPALFRTFFLVLLKMELRQ